MIKNINHNTPISSFVVHYNGSVQNEKEGTRGLSHLMEHLICKGYEKYEPIMNRYGIYTNAETSGTDILFYMNGLEPYINKFKKPYLEGLLEFNITEKQLEKEKKIVLQEYSDTFNNQANCHYLNFNRRYLNDFNAIGFKDDIKNVTLNQCKDFFNLQFSKPTHIFNIHNEDKFKQLLDFNSWRDYDNMKFDYYTNNPIENKKFNGDVSILYHSELITNNFPELHIISAMLTDGLISPLYKIIREKYGLVYYIMSELSQLNNNTGMFTISTMSNEKNSNKIKQILDGLFQYPEKILTKNRFRDIKQAIKIELQKSEILKGLGYIYPLIRDNKWNLKPNIDRIEYDDVLKVFNDTLLNKMKFNTDKEFN